VRLVDAELVEGVDSKGSVATGAVEVASDAEEASEVVEIPPVIALPVSGGELFATVELGDGLFTTVVVLGVGGVDVAEGAVEDVGDLGGGSVEDGLEDDEEPPEIDVIAKAGLAFPESPIRTII